EAADRAARVAEPNLVQGVVGKRVLVIRSERGGAGLLRSKRAGGDPAAVGKRRHRNEMIAERRYTAEHLIAVRSESMIDPDIPLVLIVDFAAGAAVVVASAGRRRQ